jgi:hypothetical protein
MKIKYVDNHPAINLTYGNIYNVIDTDRDGWYLIENDLGEKQFYQSIRFQIVEGEVETQPKPPLGIMPKKFYELQRIQEISRALYEYSHFEGKMDYDLLIRWSEELTERLSNLKYESEN